MGAARRRDRSRRNLQRGGVARAARRAGLEVPVDSIPAPTWRRRIEYVYRGTCWHQREWVAAVRIAGNAPRVDASRRVGNEKEDVLGARWWSIQQLQTSSERFYPRSLPALLPRFIAGESIDEPLERWPD